MTDFVKANTGIRTLQLREFGDGLQGLSAMEGIIVDFPFTLTDIIVSSTSSGIVTVMATDGENTHIIKSLKPKGDFNHAFEGGWTFWDNARLKIIKEKSDGIVDVAVGVISSPRALTYNQWIRR